MWQKNYKHHLTSVFIFSELIYRHHKVSAKTEHHKNQSCLLQFEISEIIAAKIPARIHMDPDKTITSPKCPSVSVKWPITKAMINIPAPFAAVEIPIPFITCDSLFDVFNSSPSVTNESPLNPPYIKYVVSFVSNLGVYNLFWCW